MEVTGSQAGTQTTSLFGLHPFEPVREQPERNSETSATVAQPLTSLPELDVAKPSKTTARPGCAHPASALQALFAARDFVTNVPFQIAYCRICGFAVTTPQPGPEQIAAYYPTGYYGEPRARRFPGIVETLQRALYARRVRMVEAVSNGKPGRVLDVGCGRGELLDAFRRRGWDVQGTELSEQAAAFARQAAKVPVTIGRLEEIGFPTGYFDAVTMWHVLEHVHNPQDLMNEVRRILKPGGVFLVAVPNFGGIEARTFRDKWFHLDVPRHLTHFTKPGLKHLLAENGFQDKVWSGFAPEYDSFSFVQSVLNGLGLKQNLLYNILRGSRAKVMSTEPVPRWQFLASVLLSPVLGALSLPATCLAGLLGQPGTITALAVKTH